MARVSNASGPTTYGYDGQGRRVKKSSGKLYRHGTDGWVLSESDLSGNNPHPPLCGPPCPARGERGRGEGGGQNLKLVVGDGCEGLAAAIQTVCLHVQHQRCWVRKMRNILERVRKRGYETVKQDAPAMVKRLEPDLSEPLGFYSFPKHLWRSLRTANVIERFFVEVRRRTRPMVCFVNVESVDRIIFSIFNRFNENWRNRILRVFTQAA
jgi:transposase-like protein